MNKKKRSQKTPIQLKLMRRIFPLLEKLFPNYMGNLYIQLFFTPFKFPFKPKEKKAMEQSKVWTIRLKDKQINVYKWGQGSKKALFVHGWSGRGAQGYAFVQSFLEKDYTFFAFDLPAHGNSTGKETNIFEGLEILKEITQTFGAFECIIGHSFGGIVATYAKVQQLPFNKLILIGSPHTNEFIAEEFSNTIGATDRFQKILNEYVLRKWNMHFDEISISRMIHELDPRDILIIHDRHDKEVPFHLAESTAQKVSKVFFIATQGLGHKRILENPEVIGSVVDFSELGAHEMTLYSN